MSRGSDPGTQVVTTATLQLRWGALVSGTRIRSSKNQRTTALAVQIKIRAAPRAATNESIVSVTVTNWNEVVVTAAARVIDRMIKTVSAHPFTTRRSLTADCLNRTIVTA